MTKDTIWKLTGCVKHYPWGGKKYIPQLICLANVDDEPFAELWFGQHPACPSIITGGTSLMDLMASAPETLLTPAERKKWKNELPFLCKILDVNDMLSIQIHPNKVQAEKGFRREEKKDIPVDSPKRTFRDQNHKPEIMYALSDFYLLHDFRPDENVVELLSKVPALCEIRKEIQSIGLSKFYNKFMRLTQREINQMLRSYVEEMSSDGGTYNMMDPEYWVMQAIDRFCTSKKIDRSILSFYFMNLVHLNPGEVIFQDSGIPHAYLKGQNIEIMANSDNVIRGGLTKKYVAAKALSRLVRFDERSVHVIQAERIDESKVMYLPPVEEFQLSVIDLKPYQEYSLKVNHISLLFSTCNCFMVESDRQKLRVSGGEAILVRAGEIITLQSRMAAKVFFVNEGKVSL